MRYKLAVLRTKSERRDKERLPLDFLFSVGNEAPYKGVDS